MEAFSLGAVGLRDALDCIWHEKDNRDTLARGLATGLPTADKSLLTAWDAATITGLPSGRLRFLDRGIFSITTPEGLEVRRGVVGHLPELDGRLIVTLLDIGTGAVVYPQAPVSGSPEEERDVAQAPWPVSHEAAKLLLAVQILRDRSDSLFLSGRDLRDAALRRLADHVKVPFTHVQRWDMWMSALLEHLET